jgi:hypothetical protein
MKALTIDGTDETPRVLLDRENQVFEISGRSLPEDSADFFNPILEWVRGYKTNPADSTHFVLRLDYLNTASSKFIQDILTELEGVRNARITWYYLEDDESMEEIGKEFAELVDVPFEFKVYE